MRKQIASMRLAAFCAILVLPLLARAQALADRVPADTIIYVGSTGVEKPGPGFAGSNLEAILNESNLPRVFDDFLPKVLDRIAAEDKQAAEGVAIIRAVLGPMWRHPSAFAFAGIDINNPNGPSPKLLLLSQAGTEAAALKTELEALLKKAGNPPFPVQVAQMNDLVAVIVGYDKPQLAIPDGGANGNSLANNAEFIKMLAQADKGAVITGYVDVERLLSLANTAAGMAPPEIQKNWAAARDKLGLKGIKRAIWSQGFDGKEWGTRLFVSAPAPRPGLIGSLLNGNPLSEETLKAIPKNATLCGATQFDIAGFISAIRGAVTDLDADTGKQIDQAIEQLNAIVGLDIENGLLKNLGNEWSWYVDPAVAGNSIAGGTLINRLKDPAKAEASLIKLEDAINKLAEELLKNENPRLTIAFRHVKLGGTTVHYLGFPAVAPAWAVRDGNLYIALYPEIAGAAAEHVASKGDSILDNPDFKAMSRRFGDHPATSIQYVDLPRLVPNTYPAWLMMSHLTGIGDLFDVPAPVMILPPLAKLLPRLSPAGQVSWTDAEGVHFRALSPFPASEVLASEPGMFSTGQAALAVSVLLPALNKSREQAQKIKSATNLKQMGLAAILFANNDKGGAFPKDFGEMLKQEELPIDVFINPRSEHSAPQSLTKEQQQEWVRDQSDYVWNGAGKKNTAGPEVPIAWEKPESLKDGINILFADGHVEFFLMEQAMQLIEKAKPLPGEAPK